VHVPISTESRRWLDSLVGIAVQTSGGEGAGREAMLSKLAELMFVEAIRSYLDRLPADARDWLAGVRDPQVGAALRLLHGRPAHTWTAERLAREVGMSRSSFADRFTAYVGIPPMHYLSRWRLQLAARLLETRSVSVGQAAAAVGYQSEAAFNRAFKRAVGQAPGAWRRGRERRPD
jgi:transcriptional regulator GlxA family with amidase domain